MKQGIPPALKQEHENLQANLESATSEPGALGQVARDLARVVQPHFMREEELVYPALGLLPALVEGRITQDMAEVLVKTQRLKDALPEMFSEHRKIRDGLEKLRAAAVAASRPTYERFADALIDHIDTEEEVLYLAAIVVGEHVALLLERERAKGAARTVPPWQSRSMRHKGSDE
jgi:iron-sulfur cluster repair protein YtfE (RIC family)